MITLTKELREQAYAYYLTTNFKETQKWLEEQKGLEISRQDISQMFKDNDLLVKKQRVIQ